MEEWLVKIKGKGEDLKLVSKKFKSSFLTIKEDNGGFYLKSDSFNHLNDHSEVELKARDIIEKINMVLKVDLGVYSLKIDDIIQIGKNKTITQKRAEFRAVLRITDPVRINMDYEELIKCLYKNDHIQEVFLFYYFGTNWFNLFKVWEIISYDMGVNSVGNKFANYRFDQIMYEGKNDIISKGWADKDEIDLFRCTAHNRKGAGVYARHALEEKIDKHCKKILTENDPMPLGVAQKLIKRIINLWIDLKC